MGCVYSSEARCEPKVKKDGDAKSAIGGSGGSDDLDSVEVGVVVPSRDGHGKVLEMNAVWVGLEKAVNVIDTIGSSMSILTPSNGFSAGATFRGNKISILAFEVSNTVGKAANLMQALSDESVQFLKAVVLKSQGVRQLVSQDPMDLLRIVAADQREEFKVFSAEVVRFGSLCKDTQWHNLGRYFQKLDVDPSPQEKLKQEATTAIQQLIILAQHTCDLYHELNASDKIEQDYRRKLLEEESMPAYLRGEGIVICQTELKRQQKLIKNLKKKSLWSRNLHEVVEKLVKVVSFLHNATFEAFDLNGTDMANYQAIRLPQRLGTCGLALHYANIINQITNIVSRPLSFNQNTRGAFYHGLPISVKTALRSRLHQFNFRGELTSVQIKAEMHKILQWLSPLAERTIKAHRDFGWVGEFANSGIEFNNSPIYTRKIIRIQTLYHADKQDTEEIILQLVVWLHHLVKQAKGRGYEIKNLKPTGRPLHKDEQALRQVEVFPPSPSFSSKTSRLQFSPEEREMLERANDSRPVLQRSMDSIGRKGKRDETRWGLSKSNGSSPSQDFSSDLESHQIWTQDLNC